MIWNLRGRHVKIINNWIDGAVKNVVPGSGQQGIESFGGFDVLISGNTVQNIGNAGLCMGSAASVPNSNIFGISAVNNFVLNCGVGIETGPAYDNNVGSQTAISTHISNNVISGALNFGIHAATRTKTQNRDLQIHGNTVSGVGTNTISGTGIYLSADPGAAVAPDTSTSNVISDNNIENVKGPWGIGIAISNYPNVRVIRNSITSSYNTGISCNAAHDSEFYENKIADSGYFAFYSTLSSCQIIKDNLILKWGSRRASPGIQLRQNSGNSLVQGNNFLFSRSYGRAPVLVVVDGNSSSVLVKDNRLLYKPR